MKLVQLLLPVADNDGSRFPTSLYEHVARDLTERFGGVTAYTRSPAEGRWQSGSSEHHDDVLVVEVMVDELDPEWWASLRRRLAAPFRQESLVIRSHDIGFSDRSGTRRRVRSRSKRTNARAFLSAYPFRSLL